jgi:hypothetical protein
MPQRVRLGCLLLSLCACAQHRAGTAPVAPVAAADHAAAQPTAARAAVRELDLDASYADLVRLAAQLDGQPAQETGCLLVRAAHRLQLSGEVTSALRPLPQPSDDLETALERAVSVNLLSLYGRHGDVPGAPTFAAFSTAPPTRTAAALIATDHGYYLRGTSAGAPVLNRQPLAAVLAALGTQASATLFVAAEAHVPVGELVQTLDALAARAQPAVLAVNLAPNTALPEPRPARSDALCPGGLADTDAPQGELEMAALQAGLISLRERAADCLGQAGAAGAAGGKLELALRIGATGTIEAACVTSDETGDAHLRACLLDLTRKLTFPAPSPRGSVDVQLPLALRARASAATPLLCGR